MDIDHLIERIIAGELPEAGWLRWLSEGEIVALVERIKSEADRHWFIDPNISLHCGQSIIRIGEITGNRGFVGLGTMAYGDAMHRMHRTQEAWDTLGKAGDIYLEAGDEVGWARTRIGRLGISVELNQTATALEDARRAREIFIAHDNLPKLLSVEVNTSLVYNYLREFSLSIQKLQEIEALLQKMGTVDSQRLIFVYSNLGYANRGLGNLREALYWYEKMRDLMIERGEERGVALVNLHIINILQSLGQNKKALFLLYETLPVLEKHDEQHSVRERFHLLECYLYFNRYAEALKLLRQAVDDARDDESALRGEELLQLARVEIATNHHKAALEALRSAESIFENVGAESWLGIVHLYRAQAALQNRDYDLARYAARDALHFLNQHNQQIETLMALLLSIRIEIDANAPLANAPLANAPLANAQILPTERAAQARKLARALNIPHLRYEAHVLSGIIAEREQNRRTAKRHYQVATRIMEQIQRSLVLTARSEFLADKQDSVQALIRLALESGDTETAFSTLERSKAQVWLSYLSQLDHLRWLDDAPDTHAIIEELNHLREEHYWYYRMANDRFYRDTQPATLSVEDATREATHRERQIRQLTERLYLHSSTEHLLEINPVALQEIQAHLRPDAPLVAYYIERQSLWAFVLDGSTLEVFRLTAEVRDVEKLIEKWQVNISRALRTAPGSGDGKILSGFARSIAAKLYDALMRPLETRLSGCERLYIVPYGALHYLPFHLFHNGYSYLIEEAEIVMLSTASLITRKPPRQPRGALTLAYGWDGRLRYAELEAQQVADRFGGVAHLGDSAVLNMLDSAPRQVLHISAHGQYRMDNPNFSFIQLADGPLYTDDLFQHNLAYELVTLSACETGRSYAAAGDELIGLGRGFLFAGAGALIASLWRVDETLTVEFMNVLYSELECGKSKAAALRSAQRTLKQQYPELHPAFWGAFELVGNPDPLT